jgi:hypothetical protein
MQELRFLGSSKFLAAHLKASDRSSCQLPPLKTLTEPELGPKDMLDAWVAAATVREFVDGRETEVG